MKFDKEFRLKPYWDESQKKLEKCRQDIFKSSGKELERFFPTRSFVFDEQKWILGSQALVLSPEQINLFIEENLEKIYHRQNITLKIFFRHPYPLEMDIKDCFWEDKTLIVQASKIQNILAFKTHSVRVYDLVFLVLENRKYIAQVTDFISSPKDYDEDIDIKDIENFRQTCNLEGIEHYDTQSINFRQGKYTDFQGFRFHKNFNPILFDKIKQALAFGGDTDIPYQTIEELNIKGRRSGLERSKFIKIDKTELPKYFTALDIGCNGAYFLRRSLDNGGGWAVGLDTPRVIEGAKQLNNFLGYFNIDFIDTIPVESFDIVFFLSMLSYFPDYEKIFKKVNHVLWFEGHGNHSFEEYQKILQPYFSKIEYKGNVDDMPESGKRVIIKCTKS